MLQTGIISLIIAQIVFQFKAFSYSSSYLPMGANESEASRNQLTFALQNEVDKGVEGISDTARVWNCFSSRGTIWN